MKVNELQPGHYYACYDTWKDEVDTSTVHIIKYGDAEKTEYGGYNVYGEITTCCLTELSRGYRSIMVHSATDFKEITEKKYAEILNKYKSLYSAIQKLME